MSNSIDKALGVIDNIPENPSTKEKIKLLPSHRDWGDENDDCLLYTSPSPRD